VHISRTNQYKLLLLPVLAPFVLLLLVDDVLAQSIAYPSLSQQISPANSSYVPQRLPVGLVLDNRLKIESFIILGQENGSEAINFDDWLLPFDELSTALGFKIKEVGDQLEISTPTQRFKLSANVITIDKTLGRAISVRSLATIPGYTVKFDIFKYAIDITTAKGALGSFQGVEPPLILDGLDLAPAPRSVGLSILQQRLNLSGSDSVDLANAQGELQAAGHVGDAGWYLRLNQGAISDPRTWNISEATILRQRSSDDLLVGSQTPFWRYRINGTGSYWAATTVQRRGFEPPVRFSGGSYSLSERLQARRSNRNISGLAEPGTVVQLVRNDRNQLLQEILVDSSGIYRFDNIPVSGTLDDVAIGRDYKILLYPRGQLTANPIVRDISFTTFSGQIPVGADAFVISAGANRTGGGTFGNFDAVQGGFLYRRGITEALTIGAGIAYDQEIRGVGELFWQPAKTLDITASATTSSQNWDHIARLNYRPSSDFYFNATSDLLSTNANAYWRLNKNIAAISSYDSQRGTSIGGEYFINSPNASTSLRTDIDDQGRIRLAANQRWDNFQANYNRNESGSNGQITYRPGGYSLDGGSEFSVGYQDSNQTFSSQLISALWRYRSPERTSDGRSLWQTELGYGWSLSGSGILATADLNILPGIQLRSSYRGISDSSSQGSYAIELTTTLLTSGGVRGTYDRVEDFRSFGKVVIRPFIDTNQNGRQDNGEENYWDPLLIRLNDRPISSFRPQIANNQADFNLPSGSYRLDIDPAGYPINSRSRLDALRVDVVNGGVTEIPIPLVPSYLVTGFIKDQKGNAVGGARVEAINPKTNTKVFSITNDSGFYTLEGLERGDYQLTIGGLPSTPGSITITPSSKPSQELNLQVTIVEEGSSPLPTNATPVPTTPASKPKDLDKSPAIVPELPPASPVALTEEKEQEQPLINAPTPLPTTAALLDAGYSFSSVTLPSFN
jgi:Carboxypeptidase regulatory-like domain